VPAVTVSDLTTLPAIPALDRVQAVERPVQSVTTAPQGLEGEGFPVRRAFAGVRLEDLDPFVHMDQMGEVEYAPGEPKGTPWHPHRGFETVTYMIDGTFQHQDSHGGGGVITDGATQWMTAGKGILHIETPPEELVVSGGLFHGIQLWVNLPARDKMIEPAYQGLEAGDVTLLSSGDGGALVRIIAGEVAGHRGPGSTHTPMALLHASLSPGALLEVPWDPAFNALVYLLDGSGRAGSDGRPVTSGQLVTFGPGDFIALRADDTQQAGASHLEVLILGGRPIREPVEHYGPFVMNTKAEIGQALEDFEAGRLGTIPPNALMPHVPDPDPVRAEHSGI
jgi:redox-sensitive bicupin YhaK (pirin superfamily)